MSIFGKLFGRNTGKATAPPPEPPWAPTGSFIDERDGSKYLTVELAGRTWMAENLAYIPHVSRCRDQGGIWVYDYRGTDTDAAKATSNYRRYGCLYDYNTAQSVCPSGWRLPTRDDCKALLASTGGTEYNTRHLAYYRLAEGGACKFNALLGGNRIVNDMQIDRGQNPLSLSVSADVVIGGRVSARLVGTDCSQGRRSDRRFMCKPTTAGTFSLTLCRLSVDCRYDASRTERFALPVIGDCDDLSG